MKSLIYLSVLIALVFNNGFVLSNAYAQQAEKIYSIHAPLDLGSFRASANQNYANPFVEEYVRHRWTGRDIALQISVELLDTILQQYFHEHFDQFAYENTPEDPFIKSYRVQLTSVSLSLSDQVENGIQLNGTVEGYVDTFVGYFYYEASLDWITTLKLNVTNNDEMIDLVIDSGNVSNLQLTINNQNILPSQIVDSIPTLIEQALPNFTFSLKEEFEELNQLVNPQLGTQVYSPILATAPDGYPGPFIMIGVNLFNGAAIAMDDQQFYDFIGSHLGAGRPISLIVDPQVINTLIHNMPGQELLLANNDGFQVYSFELVEFEDPFNTFNDPFFYPGIYPNLHLRFKKNSIGGFDHCYETYGDTVLNVQYGWNSYTPLDLYNHCLSQALLHELTPGNYVAQYNAPAAGQTLPAPYSNVELSLKMHQLSELPKTIPQWAFTGEGSAQGFNFTFQGNFHLGLLQENGAFLFGIFPQIEDIDVDLPLYLEVFNFLFNIFGPNPKEARIKENMAKINAQFSNGLPLLKVDFQYQEHRVYFDQMQHANYYADAYGNEDLNGALDSWNLQGAFPTFQELGHNFVLMGNYSFYQPTLDSDGDGIADQNEISLLQSNPYNQDTDGDGLDDLTELAFGSSPLLPDSDQDGIGDQAEFQNHQNPQLNISGAIAPILVLLL